MNTAAFYEGNTLADAEAALLNVQALVEILDRCAPDAQLSAGLFVSLLDQVVSRLDNVVGDLRTQERRPPPGFNPGLQPHRLHA